MAKISIEERVGDVIFETTNIDIDQEQAHDRHFVNELRLDSLDSVELIMNIEKEFQIAIPDEIAQGLTTFNKCVDYLRTVVKEK